MSPPRIRTSCPSSHRSPSGSRTRAPVRTSGGESGPRPCDLGGDPVGGHMTAAIIDLRSAHCIKSQVVRDLPRQEKQEGRQASSMTPRRSEWHFPRVSRGMLEERTAVLRGEEAEHTELANQGGDNAAQLDGIQPNGAPAGELRI